jgi:hypothetical protein
MTYLDARAQRREGAQKNEKRYGSFGRTSVTVAAWRKPAVLLNKATWI